MKGVEVLKKILMVVAVFVGIIIAFFLLSMFSLFSAVAPFIVSLFIGFIVLALPIVLIILLIKAVKRM